MANSFGFSWRGGQGTSGIARRSKGIVRFRRGPSVARAPLLVFVSLFVALGLLAGVQAASATTVVTFQGVLQTSNGDPIAKAAITLYTGTYGGTPSYSDSTSATGAFSLAVPIGAYSLAVTGDGLTQGIGPGWSFTGIPLTISADTTQNLTIPVAVITANVVDSLGNPVPGASISGNYNPDSVNNEVLWPGGPISSGNVAPNFVGDVGVTDSTGSVTFEALPTGSDNLTLTATPPAADTTLGQAALTTSVTANTTLSFVLPPVVTFKGVLQTSNGDPIAKAAITLYTGTYGGTPSYSDSTSATGAFSLAVPIGAYSLAVTGDGLTQGIGPGWSFTGIPLTISADTTQNLTIPVAVITANVVDSLGNPVPGASISGNYNPDSVNNEVLWPGGPISSGNVAPNFVGDVGVTDSTGSVTFEALPTGSDNLTLTATPPAADTTLGQAALTTSVTANTTLSFVLPPVVTFKGVLQTSNGDPIAKAAITLYTGTYGGTPSYSDSTSATGAFSLAVPIGAYSLAVTGDGLTQGIGPGWSFTGIPLTISADTTQNLTIPVAVITANVVDSLGNPVPGASISGNYNPDSVNNEVLWPGGPISSGNVAPNFVGDVGVTDSTGSVTFEALPTGSDNLTLTATPPSGFPSVLTESVSAGPSTLTIPIPDYAILNSAGTVSGDVSLASPTTTTLSGVSDVAIAPGSLPAGGTAPVGLISYQVLSLPVGGSVDVVLQLPPGSAPTAIYKYINGSYVDVTSIATISGNTVTLHLTDGGLGDEDGTANGVIVDPVVPLHFPPSTVTVTSPGTKTSSVNVAISPLTMKATDSNPSATITSWAATGLPAGLSINATTGVVSGTPTTTGTSTVKVTATDSGGYSGSVSFTWTVKDLVTVTSPGTKTSSVNVAISPLTMKATDSNPSATITSWAATGLPAGLSINATTGVVSGTPTTTGTSTVKVTATDSGGYSGSVSFTWTVKDLVTVTSPGTKTSSVNVAISPLTMKATDSNPSATITSWAATGLPAGLSINATTGVVSGTPTTTGTSTVKVTATDSGGYSGSVSFTWTVKDLVTVTSPGTKTSSVNVAISPLTMKATDSNPSATITSWAATGLPAGLSINATTGVVSGTPTTTGTSTVKVTATDSGGYSGSVSFTWTVKDLVTVTSPGTKTSSVNVAISPLTMKATDSNPSATITSWAATGLPAGLSINATTGVVSGTPTTTGTSTVKVTATDSGGYSGSVSFTWTVKDLVTVTSPGTKTSSVNVAISPLTMKATDSNPSATITSWAATGLPAGLSINATTGVVSGTPTTTGTSTVKVTATDSGGYSGSVSFTWTVN